VSGPRAEVSNSQINYLGPVRDTSPEPGSPWWQVLRDRVSIPFLLVVVLPTILAAIYFLFIASPRYVSEARFVVRAPATSQPSSLGMALQGVGIPSAQTDAFAVHEYITSRDATRELLASLPLREIYGAPGIDPFSKAPGLWAGKSFEDLYKGVNRYVTVGYDSTTGISTLRVEAFRAADAQRVSATLLKGGEELVNRLNVRAQGDAVQEAQRNVEEAQTRVNEAQQRLAAFRNRERFIDPTASASEGGKLIGQLAATVAGLRAERAQVAAEAPASPTLPTLDGRIRAYEQQIAIEQQKIVGNADSLAPKISTYEQMVLDREYADRSLLVATQAVDAARLDSRRKQLYLERIVSPDLPDKPTQPRRWLAILAVLGTCLLVYGTGWLIAAGVHESRQN
jgi:capsular polysaccharide transport system permease protein